MEAEEGDGRRLFCSLSLFWRGERRSEERRREKKVVRIDDETGEKKSGVIKYEGRLLTKKPFAENEMAQLTQ